MKFDRFYFFRQVIFGFRGSQVLMTKTFNILHRIPFLYKLTNLYRREQKYVLNGIFPIADEIQESEKKKSRISEDTFPKEYDDGYNKNCQSFIETVMNPKNGFSAEERKDEINTFVAAVSYFYYNLRTQL